MQFQQGGIKVSTVSKGFWKKGIMPSFQHFENNKISKNEIYLLDTNYQKADLREVSKNQPQLTEIQQELLFVYCQNMTTCFKESWEPGKVPCLI